MNSKIMASTCIIGPLISLFSHCCMQIYNNRLVQESTFCNITVGAHLYCLLQVACCATASVCLLADGRLLAWGTGAMLPNSAGSVTQVSK